MSAHLPCRSPSPGAASGCAVICVKIRIATQRKRYRAMLLTRVDKSRGLAIDKTRVFNCAALATPSSIERAHRLLQCSVMKQVNVPIRASTLSPILDLPESITPDRTSNLSCS